MTKSKWFFLVNDLEAANKAIKSAYTFGLVFVAIQLLIMGGVSIFADSRFAINIIDTVLLDTIFLAGICYALYLKPSRFAAICLFVFAMSNFAVKVGIFTGVFKVSGLSMGLLLLYAGYQGVIGTFGHHRLSKTSINVKAIVLLTFITILYSIFCFLIMTTVIFILQYKLIFFDNFDGVIGWIITLPTFLIALLALLGFLPFTKTIRVVTVVEAKV